MVTRKIKSRLASLQKKRQEVAAGLKQSKHVSLYRKFIHILIGIVLLAIGYAVHYIYGDTILATSIFRLLMLSIILDIFRVEFNCDFFLYTVFAKEKEQKSFTAITFGLLAVLLCLLLYGFPLTLAAVSMAHFSDAMAAIIGIKFGRHRFKNGKSWEGSLASLATNLLIGYFLIGAWYIFVPMALVATLTELVLTHLDDNFVVPLFTGAVGKVLLFLLLKF